MTEAGTPKLYDLIRALFGDRISKNSDLSEGSIVREVAKLLAPIPLILSCPACHSRHVDEEEFATKPHHTHACQKCGVCFRPALIHTVGVQFLPGFKNEAPEGVPVDVRQVRTPGQMVFLGEDRKIDILKLKEHAYKHRGEFVQLNLDEIYAVVDELDFLRKVEKAMNNFVLAHRQISALVPAEDDE